MQLSKVVITFLSVVGGASAGCFKHGDGNGAGDGHYGQGLNSKNVIGAVSDLMKGSYLSGEERTQCAMDTYQNKWRFQIKNTDGKTNDLTVDTVKSWLGDEAYACQYGGYRKRGVWEVTSDPNPGECVSTKPSKRNDIPIAFEA
ncbi:hypothetical protein BJ170DRAFT_357324 [Xylariales sp. AK1849]|nr:hypothetical protein BJ170DRAFT_357324 [Xylariales sp. AK1849]